MAYRRSSRAPARARTSRRSSRTTSRRRTSGRSTQRRSSSSTVKIVIEQAPVNAISRPPLGSVPAPAPKKAKF